MFYKYSVHSFFPVAKFIIPYWGDKVDYGICLYGPASLTCGSTTPYAIVNFIPPVRDYEYSLWLNTDNSETARSNCTI
jgi:hypothetical protein